MCHGLHKFISTVSQYFYSGTLKLQTSVIYHLDIIKPSPAEPGYSPPL